MTRGAVMALLLCGCVRVASLGSDIVFDAGTDGGTDAGADAGTDAGTDGGTDGGTDAGTDAMGVDRPVVPMGMVTSLVAGAGHTCATRSDGSCWCWGDNRHGQLGDGTTLARTQPVPVAGLSEVRALVLGAEHTCALAGSPTRVWCWGRGDDGQRFAAGAGDALRPEDTGLSATQLAAGGATTCVVTGGRVRCAGRNDEGQRGAEAGTDLPIEGAVTALVMGEAFGCARTEAGAVWCWGRNAEAQAGNGTITPVAPVGRVMAPPGMGAVQTLTAGGRHVCARAMDGTWCWGDRSRGQLGDGMTGGAVSTPMRTPWGDGTLVAGRDFTCGVSSQAVYCVGSNDRGQLGTPGPSRAQPTEAVSNFARVGTVYLTAGTAHACAYLSDARVWCWGDGSLGQRGDGTRDVLDMPRTVLW